LLQSTKSTVRTEITATDCVGSSVDNCS